jgi:hypothetical protein
MTLEQLSTAYLGKSAESVGTLVKLECDRWSGLCTATVTRPDGGRKYYDRSSLRALKNFLVAKF